MVFLIDKYKVCNLSNLVCNLDIYKLFIDFNDNINIIDTTDISNAKTNDELINIFNNYNFLKEPKKSNHYSDKYNNLPNLLVYGASGSGKKTFINILLEHIYNKDINNTKKVTYQITSYGNTTVDIEIEQSNYHIVIEPSNSGLDKYLIHDIVKNYAQQSILNINNCNTPFRVILINNIDNLSYYAQTSLRCTMEKYHKTCKFILNGYQSSKIIEPLRSRCLNIRVPKPTFSELFTILFNISCNENIDIPLFDLKNLVIKSDNNIKTGIWLLELYKTKITYSKTSGRCPDVPISVKTEGKTDEHRSSVPTSTRVEGKLNFGIDYNLLWKKRLYEIVDLICKFEKQPSIEFFNANQIEKIREIFYTIFITNITGNQIIIELLDIFINECKSMDPALVSIIISLFGHYECRINKGKRSIIHLEALINSIFFHILNFKM